MASAGGAALVRPYPGYGNFPIIVDVAYRWQDDGCLDLDVMVEIRSGHLMFVRPTRDLPFQADLDVSVRFEGVDGAVHELDRHQVIREMTLDRATSLERVNTFTYTLEGVRSTSGHLQVTVVDRHQERPGPRAWREHPRAFSEMSCYWVAPEPPTEYEGFSLGDPLFLRDYVEADLMGRRILRNVVDVRAAMQDHLHLARQYGLRQRYLQFACEVHPPGTKKAEILDHDGLLMQIVSRELRYAVTDTLFFDDEEKVCLGLGQSVILFEEFDVESLPPGTYLLSLTPLDGKGRPWLTEIDVVWSLGVPLRRGDEELAVARLLLPPEEVAVFRKDDVLRRQDRLDAFWAPLDPDPETPRNEAWIEFQERISYVRQHLGGFGLDGSTDPRAETYLRLGTPSRIVFEEDTSNESLRQDPGQDSWADFRGFQEVNIDRGSVLGSNRASKQPAVNPTTNVLTIFGSPGTNSRADLLDLPLLSRLPPLVGSGYKGSGLHRLGRHSRGNSFSGEPVSETWLYAHGGFPLFEHAWSDTIARGFLFVFVPDLGSYELRRTWVMEPEVPGVAEPDLPDEPTEH